LIPFRRVLALRLEAASREVPEVLVASIRSEPVVASGSLSAVSLSDGRGLQVILVAMGSLCSDKRKRERTVEDTVNLELPGTGAR
jgi:hypothetical protein